MDTVTLDVYRGSVRESIDVPRGSIYLGALGLTSIDLHSLSGLGELQTLWLYNNSLTNLDLGPLASCPHLRSLSLRGNRLEFLDLKPLGKCSLLKDLDLSDNAMESLDLEPISGCSNLSRLDISANPLKRVVLQPIAKCANLRSLTIGESELCSQDSARPSSGNARQCKTDSASRQEVDVTPLFWCGHLSTLALRGDMDLTVDPVLWYIAAAKVFRCMETVTSAPSDKSPPVLMWMNRAFFSRLAPCSYERLAAQIGTAGLLALIIVNLNRVSRHHWFHAQKGLVEGLALPELSGYDGNPLLVLDLPRFPQEYAAFKAVVRSRLVELIRKQIINDGSTLFIDVDALIAEDESALAEAIIRARREEVTKLSVPLDGRFADIGGLLLTSYGHSLVMAFGVQKTRLPVTDFEKIRESLVDAGFNIRIEHVKTARFRPQNRPKVSASLVGFIIEDRSDMLPMAPTSAVTLPESPAH